MYKIYTSVCIYIYVETEGGRQNVCRYICVNVCVYIHSLSFSPALSLSHIYIFIFIFIYLCIYRQRYSPKPPEILHPQSIYISEVYIDIYIHICIYILHMFRYESQVEALSGLTAKVERLETQARGDLFGASLGS